MSYDMSIGDEDFNLTYNVSDMLYKHNDKGIRFIDGKTGLEGGVLLLDMYHFFLDNCIELQKLNPKNGWGSWSNTVDLLAKMTKASILLPEEIWRCD